MNTSSALNVIARRTPGGSPRTPGATQCPADRTTRLWMSVPVQIPRVVPGAMPNGLPSRNWSISAPTFEKI